MKKNIFRLAIAIVAGLTFTACSNDEVATPTVAPQEDGNYHYQMTLNCTTPSYNDMGNTRAVTYTDWANGTTIYVRFKSGTSYISGTATYSATTGTWDIAASSSLPVSSTDATCEVYYFQNVGGLSGTKVNITEQTATFFTTTATYKHPTAGSITVNALLDRKTWRLRLQGTKGTAVTLPSSSNEISYISSFDLATGEFTTGKKEVNMVVAADGYTPYIYGTFDYVTGGNTVTLQVADTLQFSRKLTSGNLAVGESAYLTIPTYNSHTGWDMTIVKPQDPNATIQVKEICTFTDGIVMNFTPGSTVANFLYDTFTKSAAEALSDDELAEKIYSSYAELNIDPYSLDEATNYNFKSTSSDWYKQDTEYYLCVVAKNSTGNRGPVQRYLFKTRSESLPTAAISNIKVSTTTKWTYDIALKNNAKSYYLATNTSESTFSSDWHWYAFNVYRWGIGGELTAYDWTNVTTTIKSGTCQYLTICTWGLDANRSMGNCQVAYGNATSSASQWQKVPAVDKNKKDIISNQSLEKMRENTVIYRVSQ